MRNVYTLTKAGALHTENAPVEKILVALFRLQKQLQISVELHNEADPLLDMKDDHMQDVERAVGDMRSLLHLLKDRLIA